MNKAQTILNAVIQGDYDTAKMLAQETGWDVFNKVWYEDELIPLNDALSKHFESERDTDRFESLF